MENRRKLLKLIVVLFFSTAFIFSFSQFSSVTFGKSENLSGKYAPGTRIGALDISGKTEEEAIDLLKNRYENWQKNTKILLQYQEKTAPIDLTLFNLDVPETITSIKNGEARPAVAVIGKDQVQQQLENIFPQLNIRDFNLDQLTKALMDEASRLSDGSFCFNLYQNFMLAGHQPKEIILNHSDITLNEIPADLQSLLEKKQVVEIPAHSTFSLLGFAAKEQLTSSYSINVLATGIYQAVLPTNFSIIERNISNTLPAYAALGYEAWVDRGKGADLIISNPNSVPYHMEMALNNYHLQVSLKGEKFLYTYKTVTKDEQDISPQTIIQYSSQLLAGESVAKTCGKKGQLVKVYKETYDGDQLVTSELVSDDYYPPVYQVVLQGLSDSSQGNTSSAGTQAGSSIGTQPAAPSVNTTQSGGPNPSGQSNSTAQQNPASTAPAPDVKPVQQSSQPGPATGSSQPTAPAAKSGTGQTNAAKAPSTSSSQKGTVIDSDDVPGKSDDLPH